MVDRYRAELLPNGMVRLFDNSTLSATVFRRVVAFNVVFKISIESGPEVMEREGWEVAYAAFPAL